MPSQYKEDLIYNQYFEYTEKYQKMYGQNTIVLMQVGSFFEVYGVKHPQTGHITKSKIELFKSTCNLMIAEKSIQTPTGVLVMAGFRDYVLDKYLEKMTANGLTAVVFVQKKDPANGGKFIREFAGVYSPGTYLSYEMDMRNDQTTATLSNNLMCIWLETAKISGSQKLICGMANAHIFTGQTSIFEYETPLFMNTTTFDELERYISVYMPSEIILISCFNEMTTQKIINELVGIKPQVLHILYTNEMENQQSKDINKTVLDNCVNQIYIQHILSSLFGTETFQKCQEFSMYTIATQAFAYLIHFLQEHSPDMLRNLAIPIFKNTSTRMVLANHTLKQLNVLEDLSDDGKKMGRLSSIYTWLNRCCTPMGKRMYHSQITSPTFDACWLNMEYEMTAKYLEDVPTEIMQKIRQSLRKICDMEKIMRQMVMRKVYPQTFCGFYRSLCEIRELMKYDFCSQVAADYLFEYGEYESKHSVKENLDKCIQFIETTLDIEKCANIVSMSAFEENIIRVGISPKLDAIFKEYGESLTLFHTIRQFFNDLLEETDFVKIHETEKSGVSLVITKKRGQQLMCALDKCKSKTLNISANFVIPVKDIRLMKSTAANEEIEFPQLKRLIDTIQKCKDRMSEEIATAYMDFLTTYEKEWYNNTEIFVKFTAKLDVLQCKAHVARKYNYCRPIIDNSAERSFFDFKEMRHVLIEHIQTNELYVTNDLAMSFSETMPTGILLYGTNAVGKTSFIRAIGIAIIMAQAGFYVPCSSFRYKPYTAIYTRILGNDNLFKNLSTFAVEMSELRVILNMADENSLILGDELCSGTEIESALSIFSAGLVTLHSRKCTFLFATHFHEIAKWEEISVLTCLQMKHMSVHYDREKDCLVYDRKLRDGAGNRMYGLEVCKSLYLDAAFLEMAYGFRNRYFEGQSELATAKVSVYNSKKVRGLCEICKEVMGEETHHLAPQKLADEAGFIGSFHKNHPANLASLCEKCHDEIHKKERKNKKENIKEKK